MGNVTHLHNITPEQLTEIIFKGLDERIKELKQNFQPKTPEEYLTRIETSKLLKISLVTVHDWVKKGILKPRKIGNRTYFLRSEILQTMLNSNK